MSTKDNRIVVNLNSVQWARFGYRNQYGGWRNKLTPWPTYRGQCVLGGCVMFNPCNNPKIKAVDWLKDNNMIDVWTPELYLKLHANSSLTYTGDKAISIWKEWNRRIFKKCK